MSESKALSPIADADYEAIESAVMETQRGRWFLSEYARRNRNADTNVLLGAIQRLEKAVAHEREADRMDRLRFDLVEMARAITSTKREIAAIRPNDGAPSDLGVASEALDGIVATTERATSDILDAAEHVQEAAWTLREDGAREDLCDELDRRATEIYTHCSFQDLTAQRTKRIVDTLRFLEGRINAMIDIWGASVEDAGSPPEGSEASGPRGEGLGTRLAVFSGLDQQSIDDVIVGGRFAQEPMPHAVAQPSVTVVEPEIEARIQRAAPPDDDVVWEGDDADFTELETDVAAVVAAPEADAVAVEEPPPREAEAVATEASMVGAVAQDDDAHADHAVGEEILIQDEALGIDLDAFAEIDALSTREKLARFS